MLRDETAVLSELQRFELFFFRRSLLLELKTSFNPNPGFAGKIGVNPKHNQSHDLGENKQKM